MSVWGAREPVGDGGTPRRGKSAAEPSCEESAAAGTEVAAGCPVDHGALGARIVSPVSAAAAAAARADLGVELDALPDAVPVLGAAPGGAAFEPADQPPSVLGTS